MLFDRVDLFLGEFGVMAASAGQRAEAAIAMMPPRARSRPTALPMRPDA